MKPTERPKISDFTSIAKFIQAMLAWRRKTDHQFSIRLKIKTTRGISPSLVTHLCSGTRKLTRERIEPISDLLDLKATERLYLDQWVRRERAPTRGKKGNRSAPDNHLLQSWLHMYVKDAFSLKPMTVSPSEIHKRLGGIAPVQSIERSIRFLLKEGYLRKTIDGRIVKNDFLTVTTDDVPNEKLRAFHRRALDLAKEGISKFPPEKRRSSTVLMNLSHESYEELRDVLKGFYEQLLQFIEAHPDEGDVLCQVGIHLTPIGGPSEAH